MNKDINLRTTFNNEAELYHAIRPRYPEELFDALVKTAQLRDGAKLLEIGPGTGQATEPLAKCGYEITAVELGTGLADVARKALEKHKNVEIIYKKYKPGGKHDDNFRLSRTAELKADGMKENLFTPVCFNTFPLVFRYSAKEYAQLLTTYSPTISMAPDKRAGFLGEIEKLIEEKFGGSILKHYAMTLTMAKKKS